MNSEQWSEKLFKNFARQSDQLPFTQGTASECSLIEKEITFDFTSWGFLIKS
ncbi:MAG: hypothetical protein KBC18_01330 [Candidatus Saccharicenans sp.]|jgi:hypothetical protein|nr:hypothetical protein [Candidatus Saccharicenans sp.]